MVAAIGLRAAHAAQTRGQNPAARQIAAIMLAAHLDESLVGALHDALAADIDPGAGRHLAVHHQALAIELVEMLPRGPVRHDVGVGDQHTRRVLVGAEHADRLCPTAPAASHRPRGRAAPSRSRRSSPSCARRGRCRHRPPARPASRRRRGRGCSSACAAAPRSASSWPRSRDRAARGRCGCCPDGSWLFPTKQARPTKQVPAAWPVPPPRRARRP